MNIILQRSLFEKGFKSDPKNYRLISLLPVVSKIIEKTIHIQTQEYLDKNCLLYKCQLGLCTDFPMDSCFARFDQILS